MFYSCEVLEWVIWEFSCGEIKVVVQELGTEEKEWNVKDLPIMQFTGLIDKNGKEIYEGDIMYFPENEQNIWEMQDIKKPIIFERGAFRVDVYDTFKKVLDDETASEGEIIGNIYENPELLTKENK